MRKHKQDDQSTFSELSWGNVFALCTATLLLGTAFLWLSYQIDEAGKWVRGRLLEYPPIEDQAETIEKAVDALLLSTGDHALEVILGIHAIVITVAVAVAVEKRNPVKKSINNHALAADDQDIQLLDDKEDRNLVSLSLLLEWLSLSSLYLSSLFFPGLASVIGIVPAFCLLMIVCGMDYTFSKFARLASRVRKTYENNAKAYIEIRTYLANNHQDKCCLNSIPRLIALPLMIFLITIPWITISMIPSTLNRLEIVILSTAYLVIMLAALLYTALSAIVAYGIKLDKTSLNSEVWGMGCYAVILMPLTVFLIFYATQSALILIPMLVSLAYLALLLWCCKANKIISNLRVRRVMRLQKSLKATQKQLEDNNQDLRLRETTDPWLEPDAD